MAWGKEFFKSRNCWIDFFAGTEIGKDAKKGYSEIKEYQNLPWVPENQPKNSKRKTNKLKYAVREIINCVETEKMPRRIMLGYDIIPRVKWEIESLKKDLKLSKKPARNCAKK